MSTVLDVAFCLLLVGVAVTTLTVAAPDESRSVTIDSDPTAQSIATVTATVRAADGQQAHGTLANHLARATIINATTDGEQIARSTYPDAVSREIENHTGVRSHITARWEPYPDAPIESQVSVGSPPPETADVATTTLTVDSGIASSDVSESFDSIAESIAEAYVTRLFPPERTRVRLVDARTATPTAERYEEAAETFEADLSEEISDASARGANERLTVALAEEIESDLRDRYETADEAADETGADKVVIVVRRWEP